MQDLPPPTHPHPGHRGRWCNWKLFPESGHRWTQHQITGHRRGVARKRLHLLCWSTRDAPGILCGRLWEGEVTSGNGSDLQASQVLGSQCEGSPTFLGQQRPRRNQRLAPLQDQVAFPLPLKAVPRPRLRARRGVSQVNSTLPTWPPETSLPGGVDVAALALGSQRPFGLRTLPPHHRPGTPTHHDGDLDGSAGLEQGRGWPRRSPTDRLLRSPGEKSIFLIYVLIYCIGVFLSDFTLYNRLQFNPPPQN